MTQNEKMDQQLKTSVQKIADRDPGFLLDVVVTPEDQKDIGVLVDYICQSGGKPTQVNPDTVSCKVPAGQVRHLAESALVASVRLARLHRMH
jgi:hypothetical protein